MLRQLLDLHSGWSVQEMAVLLVLALELRVPDTHLDFIPAMAPATHSGTGETPQHRQHG